MRIVLVHNPQAGRGNHAKRDLMAALAKAGHEAISQSIKKNDYKKALKESTDLVLAAGGDGTVGKVGCELIDTGIPLSVLPLGTANNSGAQSWLHRLARRNHYRAKRLKKASV